MDSSGQKKTIIESNRQQLETDGKRWKAAYIDGHWTAVENRDHIHTPSIRFQPMRVPEEPVCIDLFRKNPVFYLPAFEISRSCRTASEDSGRQ
jgi:hypothetical protein